MVALLLSSHYKNIYPYRKSQRSATVDNIRVAQINNFLFYVTISRHFVLEELNKIGN